MADFKSVVESTGLVIEAAGVTVIVIGMLFAVLRFAWLGLQRAEKIRREMGQNSRRRSGRGQNGKKRQAVRRTKRDIHMNVNDGRQHRYGFFVLGFLHNRSPVIAPDFQQSSSRNVFIRDPWIPASNPPE